MGDVTLLADKGASLYHFPSTVASWDMFSLCLISAWGDGLKLCQTQAPCNKM